MSNQYILDRQFNRADVNHDGTIDEQEFRQFLGPIRDERRLSAIISSSEVQSFNEGVTETITYPVGIDVALAGFTQNPIEYEKYAGGSSSSEGHRYDLGPDVGIGAPNLARKTIQYDPAGAMFNYADVNCDGKIDLQEFGSFMRSV